MQTLKAIAVLLHYPDELLQAHAHELAEPIRRSAGLSAATRQGLLDFIDHVQRTDLLDLQAGYVGLFDRGRSLSLHLFEHVHGESRDRGQAMVDLVKIYEEQGFRIQVNELPDYVPLFLEFCAQLPADKAQAWLGEVSHLLLMLQGRLAERDSEYRVLFDALLELGGVSAADDDLRRRIRQEPRDDTPEALDQAWAEEPVVFGPAAAGCGGATTNSGQAVPVAWPERRQVNTTTRES